MSAVVIAAMVFGALFVLSVVRLVWRLFSGREELEPGGSWGTQLFGRRRD